MAVYVIKTHKLKLGTSDISAYVRSCELTMGAELQDSTAMGATARGRTSGLITWEINAELQQDAADSLLDEIIATIMATGTSFTIKTCPGVGGSTTGSATNPIFHGSGLMTEYIPKKGEVGGMAMCSIKVKAAGSLTRDTDNSPVW